MNHKLNMYLRSDIWMIFVSDKSQILSVHNLSETLEWTHERTDGQAKCTVVIEMQLIEIRI